MQNSTVPEGGAPLSDKEIISHAVQTLAGGRNQWVLWQYVEREDSDKPTKVPITKGNKWADSSDPDTWLPYDVVKDAYYEYDDYEGIGIMFDGSFVGIDLDDCLEDGVITDPLVEEFVDVADTYTEISPSGTGLHLYFKLTRPLRPKSNRHGKYEVYTTVRYFTFTENLYNQNTVRTTTPEEVESLLGILGYPWNPVLEAVSQTLAGSTNNLDLEIVKQKMFASKHGGEIEVLYNGDTSAYGGDTSRADMALCKHLAYWTNGNREAVKTLWLASGLAQRDKTQLRDDYVVRTLDYALSGTDSDTGMAELEAAPVDSTNGSTDALSLRQRFAASEIDLEDLLNMDIEVEWDVEQLITAGSLNMIASPPHQGKTFMALHISVCMAYGLPVFGKFKVAKNKNVMIINEEDILAELKGRLEEMVPEERVRNRIKLYESTGDKVSDEWADAVIERAKINNTGLIILDSFGSLSLANENDSQAVYEVMDCFRRFVREGITVIFIHHDRKSSTQGNDAGPQIDRARGSSAIGAVVHGYLSIKELSNEQFVVSQLKLKAKEQKMKPFVVQKNRKVCSDASFVHEFKYLGEYNSDATAAEGIEDRIAELCQEQGAGFLFTRKTLVDHKLASGTDDKTLRNSLKWMEDKALLGSCKYNELPEEKRALVVTEVKKANTVVYWATDELLSADGEKEVVDESEIVF
ncbi:AAA family ATPase [Candidatus Saccharibacteria bacterium]|nr:AAA family ATPase [Candidatus Saccharibacteria bacterium]